MKREPTWTDTIMLIVGIIATTLVLILWLRASDAHTTELTNGCKELIEATNDPYACVPTTKQPSTTTSTERIDEDDPRWDCRTMGNKICGPKATLPEVRTTTTKAKVAPPTTAPPAAPIIIEAKTIEPPKPRSLLEIAQGEVGRLDGPYVDPSGWCHKFVNWLGTESRLPGWVERDGPYTLIHNVTLTAEPQPGYLVFVDLLGDGGKELRGPAISHVGVVEWIDGDKIGTIEGNASKGSRTPERMVRTLGDGYVVKFGRLPEGDK